MRNEFDDFVTAVNAKVEKANKEYIDSLNSYQQCLSNPWRAAFATVIPEIDARRKALDEYKKDAYDRAGKQNYELFKTAAEYKINRIKETEDISEFVLWYKNHISFMKAGPLHEIEVYSVGYKKLTDIYNKMANSCKNNSKNAADFDLIASGIKGLLDGVFSLIGKVR